MSADSLVSFVQSLSRAFVSAADPSVLAEALQECWHLLRHMGSEGAAVTLSMPESGHAFAQLEGRDRVDLNAYKGGEAKRNTAIVRTVLQKANVRAVTFLPGMDWKELATGVPVLIAGGDDARFKLTSLKVYRLVASGLVPALSTERTLPEVVADGLDVFYVTFQGIQRHGPPPDETPRDVLTRTGSFLVRRLPGPTEARSLLANLDLPLQGAPPQMQAHAMRMLVGELPEEWLAPLLESCERIVGMAGGPRAVAAKTDQAGVPLLGYYMAARAIRERTGADSGESQGLSGVWQMHAVRSAPQPATPQPAAPEPYEHDISPAPNRAGSYDISSAPSPTQRTSGSGLHRIARNQGSGIQRLPSTTESGLLRMPRRNTQSGLQALPTHESGLHRVPRTHESGMHRMPPMSPNQESGVHRVSLRHESSGVYRRPQRSPTTESGLFQTGAFTPTPGSDHESLRHTPVQRDLDQRVDGWIATFPQVGPRLIDRARDVSDADGFKGAVKILANVAGAFLESGRWADALPTVRLLKLLEMDAADFSEEVRLALAEALRLVLPPEGAETLVLGLPDADFQQRAALLELIAFYEVDAVPALLKMLSYRRLTGSLRKQVVACIEAVGPPAGPHILEAIEQAGRRWNRTAPYVALLGAVGYRGAQRQVIEFLRHPQPKLREEALVAVYQILGTKSHRYLVHALDDADPGVCQRAVSLLAATGSSDANFTGLLSDLIDIDQPEDPREEGLIITAVRGLRDLGNVKLGENGRTTAESALIGALKQSWGGGFLGFGRGTGRSPGIQEAMVETLGEIGGDKARSTLMSVPRDAAVAIRDAATAAIERIGRRLTS